MSLTVLEYRKYGYNDSMILDDQFPVYIYIYYRDRNPEFYIFMNLPAGCLSHVSPSVLPLLSFCFKELDFLVQRFATFYKS